MVLFLGFTLYVIFIRAMYCQISRTMKSVRQLSQIHMQTRTRTKKKPHTTECRSIRSTIEMNANASHVSVCFVLSTLNST